MQFRASQSVGGDSWSDYKDVKNGCRHAVHGNNLRRQACGRSGLALFHSRRRTAVQPARRALIISRRVIITAGDRLSVHMMSSWTVPLRVPNETRLRQNTTWKSGGRAGNPALKMATKLDLLYDNANYIEHLTCAQKLVSGSETVASVHLIIWKILVYWWSLFARKQR